MFIIKLNDNKNGLSSNKYEYKSKAIYIHKICNKYNINITCFDYIPDFGIHDMDWIDTLHWTDEFYIKWSHWIIYKINSLLLLNKIKYSLKHKILIISDSTLDYNTNRKNIFKQIINNYNIPNKIIAKGGGSFSSRYKSINFYNMINKKKIKNKKYAAIIIIGGINDTFCSNNKLIKNGIFMFSKLAKKLIHL